MGSLHALIMKEHSSESVVSDMTLYYAQYKHTQFGRRSCLEINETTSALAVCFFFCLFSRTFCSEFCFNLSEGTEQFV